ncbi:MAG: Gfo/Idh/MocA family oxidoreductase [Ignavibacteriales bacterium]|nr:Gfo/Idh/MocA family oxidoreductase [Ignavibacteriales bacterium]MCF8315160.1 Gfo/Idh/MocA family oxidoreductase [Ignavibacteriales bacterium]MCF8435844.1 Gfo/Idh/MocA family oxidoreductase [Ignavibacteriales bacterium]
MPENNLNIAIIGSGKWGMNHVKTASFLLGPTNVTVCDTFPGAKVKVDEVSKEIKFTHDLNEIINNNSIAGVIVATPAETHFEVTEKLLLGGKHVLVEKPITLISHEAAKLIEIAEVKSLTLMVGHVLLFHPAIIKLKQLIDEGKIGELQYIYSNRLNLGTIRSEENSLWSFAPHDISIIQYLCGNDPISVYAKGADLVQSGIEDTTLTYLAYPNNVHAHIFVSWLHPFKEQRLVVIGEKGMFVFEDSLKTEKLKFYKKGFLVVNGSVEKFESEYEVVSFENTQPLAEEHKHFYNCIINNTKPLTDGPHALEVLKILEKATESIKSIIKNY